jgi:hypothetical protein
MVIHRYSHVPVPVKHRSVNMYSSESLLSVMLFPFACPRKDRSDLGKMICSNGHNWRWSFNRTPEDRKVLTASQAWLQLHYNILASTSVSGDCAGVRRLYVLCFRALIPKVREKSMKINLFPEESIKNIRDFLTTTHRKMQLKLLNLF